MYRFHVYGNPSVPGTVDLTSDAFTQTAYKYGKVLKEMGHYVIMYGTQEFASEFICDEFVPINSLQDFREQNLENDSKRMLIEKYSRGSYLSNMLNSIEEKQKREIVQKSRIKLLQSLNETSIKLNDIFLTFWDIVDKEIFIKIEKLGGIVIEGLCQYGTSSWNLRFTRTVFASFSELNRRYKVQQFSSKHHVVIPPFFDENEFTYCEKKEDVYLYLGRIQEHKGFGIIKQLAKKFPNKIFWVAGQARTLVQKDEKDHTYSNIPILGTSIFREAKYLEYQKYNQDMAWVDLTELPNLIYKGLADKQLRRELLSKASVLIQPSMYDEPFGWNVIEANLSGTPVITSDRGAFLDTVKDDVNGYRLDPTSSYEKWELILDKAKKLSSQECYNFSIKNYTVDCVMSRYIKYIEKIVQDKGNLFKEL